MAYERLNKKSKEILYASDINHIEDGLVSLEESKVDAIVGKGLSTNDYTRAEKTKLAGIEDNANAYTHPATHPASMITETSEKRFVSDTEKAAWNAKATESFVTEAIANAQLNGGQGGSVDLSGYVTTTALNTALNEKVDKVSGKSLSTNDYTNAEKTKLAGIEANANNYTHPSSHPASIITETSEKRFVTDSEKIAWNNKVDENFVNQAIQNAKLEGTDVDLSGYVTTLNFNKELAKKVNVETGKGLSSNDYTTTEKNKLAGIAANANNYTHPDKHPASIITESTTQQFVTAAQKTEWSNKLNSAYPSSANQTVANAIGGFAIGDSLSGMSLVQIIEKMLCTTSSSGGEDTPTPEIIHGRIPIAEVGGHIIPYSSITEDMIKNCSQLEHKEVKTMGRTSFGLPSQTAEGDYTIVLVPKESGLTVTKDNGIGGKVRFNTNTAGANGDVELTVNNVVYKVYGEILLAQGQMYFYVD